MMMSSNLMKKYALTTVLLCIIITTFVVTRNKWSFKNDYPPGKAKIKSKRSIPLELQSKIKTLALFIGYPRSGHTLISSLLDAHPHMVISNELDIFERWREWTLTEKTRENIFNRIYQNSQYHSQGSGFRSPTRNRGRTYAVPNQWQGRYENYIKVIGDKKGGKTSKFLSGKQWQSLSKEVLDEIKLPIKLIHIVRNPYDNIATMTFRSLDMSTEEAKASNKKISSMTAMDYSVRVYLWEAKNNYYLIKRYGARVLTLHSEDIIANPKVPLKKLCEFLEVTCSEDYINDCSSIIYKKTSKTRTTIVWPDVYKRMVEKAIKEIPFLRRYSFES